MAAEIVATEADYAALCPHCEESLDVVHGRRLKTSTHTDIQFICARCRKVIGFSSVSSDPIEKLRRAV